MLVTKPPVASCVEMSDADLNQDFRDMLDALVHEHVEFLIIGAHALAAYGLPRATGDLDIFIRPTPDNARCVMEALRRFGAPLSAHHVEERDFQVPGNVYQIGLPPRRIDLLTQISGVTFEEAMAEHLTIVIAGHEIRFIGRDALIKNKRAAARDKDLVDVAALERGAAR
jgi:predicted nucleotidyltransferase